MILTNKTSNWPSPASLTILLPRRYLKIGISTILHAPDKLGGLLVSLWFAFTSPRFVPYMFSPSLGWKIWSERKLRHSACTLCSGHLLSSWGDPPRQGGLTCDTPGIGEVSSGLSRHSIGPDRPMKSIWRLGHKISPIVVGMYDLSSVSFWLFLSVRGREEKRNVLGSITVMEAGGWRSTSGGSGTNRGSQVMTCKHVPCLVPASRTLQAPLHSFSNSIFRRHVQRPSWKSFKYQFVSDERFCVYSPCGFPEDI